VLRRRRAAPECGAVPPVSFVLAWRILIHDKGRTALAIAGVFMAILLVFVELGFFIAVPRGGMLLYDKLRFDLLVASKEYEYQAQPGAFPRTGLDKARAAPQVAQASALYFGQAKWESGASGKAPDVFVIGFNPQMPIFTPPDIYRQRATLDRADTLLVDSATRPMFGPLDSGRVVEVNRQRMTIGGDYVLGTGFMGLGVILVSEPNFTRLFPFRTLDQVNLGLVEMRPGVDPDAAATTLQKDLGDNFRVFTRPELEAHETAYWTTRTSVGLLFGSGLLVAFIVGIMVVYQVLATQVSRQLPQFATLKAIGYADRTLGGTVVAMALLIVLAGFLPALAAAFGVYTVIRDETLLPVTMSGTRVGAVFVATLLMAAFSALLSAGSLRRADPADIF
jgi:putative ABC transport system permease protein